VIRRNSFWPLESLALHISSMTEWLDIILHPGKIGIPTSGSHLFQIFATVACDHIWFARNKALHEALVPNAMSVSAAINKLVKEHFAAWSHKNGPSHATWSKSKPLSYKINYDTAIRNNFSAQDKNLSSLCNYFCRSTSSFIGGRIIFFP